MLSIRLLCSEIPRDGISSQISMMSSVEGSSPCGSGHKDWVGNLHEKVRSSSPDVFLLRHLKKLPMHKLVNQLEGELDIKCFDMRSRQRIRRIFSSGTNRGRKDGELNVSQMQGHEASQRYFPSKHM